MALWLYGYHGACDGLVTNFVTGVGIARLVLYALVAQTPQFIPSKATQLRSIHSPMEKPTPPLN